VDNDETRAFAQRLMADSNRAHLGAGHTDFAFGALREIGFDGYLAMEYAVRGDAEMVLPQVTRRLRSLMT
jgi:sugar phosphate isomerase/epimerase